MSSIHIDGTTKGTYVMDTIIQRKHIDVSVIINDMTKLELGSFIKTLEKRNSDNNFVAELIKWNLNSIQIANILKGFKPITGHDIYYGYQTLLCELEGEVKINGSPYKMTINL
jgi:hypothetical protein